MIIPFSFQVLISRKRGSGCYLPAFAETNLKSFWSYDFLKVSFGKKKKIYAVQRRKTTNKILSLVIRNSRVSDRVSKLTIGKGRSAQALEEPITIGRSEKNSVLKQIVLRYFIHCYLLSAIFLLCFITPSFSKTCSGRFVNPISDICWSCLFPISIGPVNVSGSGREDTENPTQIPCFCPRPPLPFPVPGVPIGFWEPARLVDVTRTPFCMVNMGGLQLGNSTVGYGTHGQKGVGRTKHSLYQVHWYIYPVIYWLELLMDFLCLEQQSFDVAYITELDPLWNEDELSFILNPEAALFGNPIAQAACSADCAAASSGFSMDVLFWCGGCQGSLYPFTGNNTAHVGGVQASLLLTQRMMAKLHRELLLWGTSGQAALCQKYPLPIIKKTQYKTQMTYPRPTTRGPMACNPLGRTEVIWGTGREFPYKGEDFGYLIWQKRNCCAI